MRSKIGCRKSHAAVSGERMAAAIDTDADDDNESFSGFAVRRRLAFNENARALAPVEQQVIGHLNFNCGASAFASSATASRSASAATKASCGASSNRDGSRSNRLA